MALLEELASGSSGIRWAPPASFDVQREERRSLLARDLERRVTWLVRLLPWPLDLRRAFDAELRQDLEVDARRLFEQEDAAVEWPPGSEEKPPPRTSDPTWSPVVEHEHMVLDGAPALRVVRRLTYRPGNEIISGAILVPLAKGFAEIAAMSRAGMTGYRESVLMLMERKGDELGPDMEFPKQSVYDDPRHDATFADHPLSLVRAALRWLVTDAGIAVPAPMKELPEGEVILEGPGCAVVPPPRYLPVSREVMPMSPTLASFVRVALGDSDPRLLDVWRPDRRIEGRSRERDLLALVARENEAWESEGAKDIVQAPKIVAGDGASAAVQNVVRFNVAGKPQVSAQRWRADRDGTVFRVAAGGRAGAPEASLLELAETVMASLRRLDVEEEGPRAPAAKPWWKIW